MAYLIRISASAIPDSRKAMSECLQPARDTYQRFHCLPARCLYRLRCPKFNSQVQVDLGELRGLIYRSPRGPEQRPRTFIHFFETPARLSCDPSGRQLYIHGGNYCVTHRGIEG